MSVMAWLVGMVVGSVMEVKERTTLRRRLLQGSLHLNLMLLRVTGLFRGGSVEQSSLSFSSENGEKMLTYTSN